MSLNSKKLSSAIVVLFLAFLFFLIRYFHFIRFGLYEDDLTIIPKAMQMSFGELFTFILNYIKNFYGHGRPLSDSFIYFFSNVGWRFAGFSGPYILGYIIVTINAILFFFLLKKIRPGFFAISGAIFYVLFSADTTQAFLTHSLGLQPSLTLLLLGFHCYSLGRKWLAYCLVFIILFSYETPFLVFLGAPLLIYPVKRKNFYIFIPHILILCCMMVSVILLRSFIGEGRVAELSTIDMIKVPITHMIQGPIVSLGTYAYRPILTMLNLNIEILVFMGILFPVFYLILNYYGDSVIVEEGSDSDRSNSIFRISLAKFFNQKDLLTAGIIMLISAYPLTFTVRAYAISGRDTRVHAAAVVGSAVILACASTFIWELARYFGKSRLFNLFLSIFFVLMLGYGFVIQKDYVMGWSLQQDFWREIIPLALDVEDNAVVFVEPSGLENPRQIDANTWNLPRIFEQLFIFPDSWENPPRVYRLTENWEDHLVTEEGKFRINALTAVAPPSLYGEFSPDQVIFIHSSSGHLSRRSESLPVGDRIFDLKPSGSPILNNFETGFLYSIMLGK